MKNINKISVLIAFCGVFFLFGCSKDKGTVTPNVLRKLAKATYSDGNFNTFSYDAKGRCATINSKTSDAAYDYNGNTVTQTVVNTVTNTVTISTFTLNAQGLAIKQTFTSSPYDYSYDREYDANGFLTKIISKRRASGGVFATTSETTYTRDSDGNLLSFREVNASGTVVFKVDNEYDKSHYATTTVEFSGREWLGRSSPHYNTKSTITQSPLSNGVTNYTATFDKKGYAISEVRTTTTAAVTGTFTYK